MTRRANQWHLAIIEDCKARADSRRRAFFFGPTLAQGSFNSSKLSLHVASNSFTNWKRLVRRAVQNGSAIWQRGGSEGHCQQADLPSVSSRARWRSSWRATGISDRCSTSLTRSRAGVVARARGRASFVSAVIDECTRAVTELGHPTMPAFNAAGQLAGLFSQPDSTYGPSMLSDMEDGRPTEAFEAPRAQLRRFVGLQACDSRLPVALTSASKGCVQPVSATPSVVYRLAFRSPRSFADVD